MKTQRRRVGDNARPTYIVQGHYGVVIALRRLLRADRHHRPGDTSRPSTRLTRCSPGRRCRSLGSRVKPPTGLGRDDQRERRQPSCRGSRSGAGFSRQWSWSWWCSGDCRREHLGDRLDFEGVLDERVNRYPDRVDEVFAEGRRSWTRSASGQTPEGGGRQLVGESGSRQ